MLSSKDWVIASFCSTVQLRASPGHEPREYRRGDVPDEAADGEAEPVGDLHREDVA